MREIGSKYKTSKIFDKVLVSLIASMFFILPATAISINKTEKLNKMGGDSAIWSLGDTLIVDDDGTTPYTTIQQAINAASSGDYIIVKDGTYGDQLTVNVGGLVISAASGETPTIYVSSYDVGIDVTAPDVTIEGFEIFGNGSLTGGPFPTVKASAGADGLLINQNNFKVFTGELGQIALLVASTVNDASFTNNVITNYNKGVQLESNSDAGITGNTFSSVEYDIYHASFIQGENIYYGSIQNAIDVAVIDDTVKVTEGTFFENVNVDKSLNLEGAKAGENPVVGRTGEESIIDGNNFHAVSVAIGVTDVKIDGFTVTVTNKPNNDNIAGIVINKNTDQVSIENNIIKDITDGGGVDQLPDETYGIMVYGRDAGLGQTNITIRDNYIYNVEEYGIAINDKTSYVTISGNMISDLIGANHDDLPDPTWPAYFCSGIHLGGQVGPIANITIDSNYINTEQTGDGVLTAAGGGITFAGVAEWADPSNLWKGFDNITITNNEIYNNTQGILSLIGDFTVDPEIHFNNVSANIDYGINNTVATSNFQATNNWWGDITGPYHPFENSDGLGVPVSDNVTFWPWQEFDGYSIPPTVEYIVGEPNALGGEVISDNTDIEILAEDDESGLLSLEYRVWSSSSRWSEWKEYTNTFELSGDGQKIVEYNATDNAGTKVNSFETHRVDTTPPYTKVIYPNGGEFIRGNAEIQWEAADRIPDQEQTEWNNYWSLTEEYPGHIQSFQPTESTLNSIFLLLEGEDAEVTVRIYSNISTVPTQIAQSTKHLQLIGNENNPVWIDFPLNNELDLDTDSTYYIGVTQNVIGNEGINWYYFDSTTDPDPYLYGNAWLRKIDTLEENLDWDFAFRTIYWDENLDITLQYSPTGVSPWSTIADQENNDGSYIWDTSTFPDGGNYRIRVIAEDVINILGADISDNTFQIDNTGPIVSNIVITDTTIGNSEYTKNGDNLEITANVEGNPVEITADLSGFGKGDTVPATSYLGNTATWLVDTIVCAPSDGKINVVIQAEDPTGDTSGDVGSIIADNTAPMIEITRPGPGIYIMDSMRLLPFAYPLIIGQITMRAEAEDNRSGIRQVEFFIEDKPVANISTEPYEYLWDEASFGFFTVEVVAIDNVGHTSSDLMRDFFILNFDIFG